MTERELEQNAGGEGRPEDSASREERQTPPEQAAGKQERQAAPVAQRPEQGATRLPYLAGFDGLRAIAVIAVLIYHAGLGLAGGFLGVETFFVLSGYLISSLLLAEWRQLGRVRLGAFWLRRARRLLPALFLMLLGTAIAGSFLLPTAERGELGGEIISALTYIMNWQLIASQQSYFDPTSRPPLLQHLWSLAIEEQFYLVWPLLFFAGMRLLRRGGLLVATLLLAGGSIALMALLFQPGTDPSRIYYGTDTRAGGLLLGSALALVWPPASPPFAQRRAAGVLLELLGALALCALIASFVLLYARHPLLYRGGIALVALATALVLAAVCHPRTRLLPALLGWAPLRWIGLRSYGIYLWHWPIFMLTRPRLDLPLSGWQLLALRFGLTLALAELSYRLVEHPMRARVWTASGGHLDRERAKPREIHERDSLERERAKPPKEQGAGMSAPAGRPGRKRALAGGLAALMVGIVLLAGVTQVGAPGGAPARQSVATPTGPALGSRAATSRRGRAIVRAGTTQPDGPAPFDPALADKLQAALDELIAEGEIPGVVMAVSLPGQETWLGASGLADLNTGEPMTADSIVRIASISKMFTAVVVLQLVEEGKLALDQPVEAYLPGLLPDGQRITVRQLLSQTSGLYDFLEDREFVDLAYQDPEREWQPAELVAYANDFWLAFEPGEPGQWDYSSTNYVVLGMLVEQVTGNSLGQELRRRIFDPLELKQTFFVPDETVTGQHAHGYSGSTDQTQVAMSFAFGTGNVASTADDLQYFIASLFDGALLKPETMQQMLSFVDGHGQYNMPDLAYGLGVMRHTLPVGPGPDAAERAGELSQALGHIGGFGGFRAAAWFVPADDITIAFAVNQTDVDPNTLATTALDIILTHQGK